MAYTVVNGKLVKTTKARRDGYLGGYFAPVPSYNTSKPDEFPKDKGQYLGHCNRSACLAPAPEWYNRGSHAFYCEDCAYMLSNDSFNSRDAEKLFGPGQKLCYKVKSSEEASQLHVSTRV